MVDSGFRLGIGAVLSVVVALSFISNIFVFISCSRRKRLRIPPRYFLISLAILDVLAAGFWSIFTVISLVSDRWIFSMEICKVQEYFKSLYVYLNAHTLVILASERCLLFVKPSKHSEVFINTVVVLVILAIWIFDGVLAAFPFFGWGEVAYFSNQFQCAMDYEKNIRQMNFWTVMCFGLPIVCCLILYIVIFIMVRKIKKNEDDDGALIVQKNYKAVGDSYAQRLKNQQYKFQNAGTRTIKPNIGKKFTYTADGYISNDSSDDENTKKTVEKEKKSKKIAQKKVYHMAKNDVIHTKTYATMTSLYFVFWIPYVVISYIYVKDQFANIGDEIVLVCVFLSHCTLCVKPAVYVFMNAYLRGHFVKSLGLRKLSKTRSNDDHKDTGQEENPKLQGYENQGNTFETM